MSDKLTTHLLAEHGQSPWLDDISKCWLDSGKLEELVYKQGIRGMTTNPSIFQKAISSGECGYPEEIQKLAADESDPVKVYEALCCADVQRACDVMRKLYDKTDGADGFVSWEVAPEWAHDEEKTVSEAHRLWEMVDRPNLFIKVPATEEGIKAFRRLIRDGININMTLIFSREQYRAVAENYIAALDERWDDGNEIDHVRSVASVFVSRIDTQVDKALEAHKGAKLADELRGRIGIANCKLIYQDFRSFFKSEAFDELAEEGAAYQRPLWASTGTKNPEYSDVLYVDELIGPYTVNTLPMKTLEAFLDHGEVDTDTVLEGVYDAGHEIEELEELGISLDEITAQLLVDGLKAFADSYDGLIDVIRKSLEVVHEG